MVEVKWRGLDDLLHHVPVGDEAKRDLVARMGAASRFYHGIDHLALLWQRHKIYAPQAALEGELVDTLVASAIAYHDCIYEGGRPDNEDLSAECWMDAAMGSPLSDLDRVWVAETIRATQTNLAYRPSDAFDAPDPHRASSAVTMRERARIWMLDLDLTPLGEAPAAFDRNTEMLRKEVPHLSDAEWERARLAFLRQYFEAPKIYRSPTLADAFAVPARRNLARQLAKA